MTIVYMSSVICTLNDYVGESMYIYRIHTLNGYVCGQNGLPGFVLDFRDKVQDWQSQEPIRRRGVSGLHKPLLILNFGLTLYSR